MDECPYCEESFTDEAAYLRHLGAEHEGELGPIEQRRVATVGDEGGVSIPTGPAILGGVFLLAVGIVIYVIFFVGGSSAEIGTYGSAHEHGTVEMRVLGDRVDFSQPQYQTVADRFHFEAGNGRVWHKHATGVTLAWGMSTLGIELTETSVTYNGRTYRDNDSAYEVGILVNGEPVDPESYVLSGVPGDAPPEDGDRVRIVVRRANASG